MSVVLLACSPLHSSSPVASHLLVLAALYGCRSRVSLLARF